MNTAIIFDIHGDLLALKKILFLCGAIDASGERLPDWRLIQVGDLMHRGGEDKDVLTGSYAFRMFDEILMGNHEFSDFGGPGFNGYEKHPVATRLLHNAREKGQLKAATTVGKWLVSHAGLHPWYWYVNYDFNEDVELLAFALNRDLNKRITRQVPMSLFDSMGPVRSRESDQRAGGLFWCDLEELVDAYKESGARLPQIVGHTPTNTPLVVPNVLLSNDAKIGRTGQGYAGAFISPDNGETWEALRVEPEGL